jgi:hypothetical protein
MHGPINVKSPNNTSKWQMGFNSAFKGLIQIYRSKRLGFAQGNIDTPYTGSYTAFTYDEKSEIKPLTSCG